MGAVSSVELDWLSRESGIESFLRLLQKKIVQTFEQFEAGEQRFLQDEWTRAEGGGGLTCVLQQGAVFEKFGVGFSSIQGDALPNSASSRRQGIGGKPFLAMGVSLVVHPLSPMVPTAHMNVRYFRTFSEATGEPVWWFGGGYDLTPYYPFDEDCIHWHQTAKSVCDRHSGAVSFEKLKQNCDEYFYIQHRKCGRGIGGVFFDDLNKPGFEASWDFVKDIGTSFIDAYEPIVSRRKDEPYGDNERQFQLYRRGRYVEFNLVYDRGTLFGLQSGGRVESILMSMPPLVRFDYGWQNETDSKESKLESEYLIPRDWANGG